MIVKLPRKFADKHLDATISKVYNDFKTSSSNQYIFDLSDVEFIANQELLVLSSLFSLFVKNGVDFKVLLFKEGVSTVDFPPRVRRQIIELWVVWEIWRIIPNKEYYKYFGIDGRSIEGLQKLEGYYPSRAELYGRHGITPFIPLDFINNYNANEVQIRIDEVFKLSNVIKEILDENQCFHPFTSNSLSTIVSEELYLNFLDHSQKSAFDGFSPFASLSISFKKKYRDSLSYQNKNNFESEQIPETKSFFYDSKKKQFRNRGFIEFTFLDFGSGIPNTLRSELPDSTDSDILKFAFQHNSSRHAISTHDNRPIDYLPRGLFDALSVVRRYKGLLVARSNYGKVLFDFSDSDEIENACCTFGSNEHFFPGTLISLYIPAIKNEIGVSESSIKPEVSFDYIKPRNKKYLNINQVLKDVGTVKESLYSDVLSALREAILFNHDEPTIAYLSFLGCKIEDRVVRKILIYLMTDYDINVKTNVVLLHKPKEGVIQSVTEIVSSLSSVYRKYKIHPLPVVQRSKSDEIKIQWLGIYDKYDIKKLDDLLYSEFSLAKSDFNQPANLEGHILSFDTYGNLLSNFPDRGELIDLFGDEESVIIGYNLQNFLEKNDGIVEDNGSDIYLCNGNYYQREYIEINNIFSSKDELENLAQLFFTKILSQLGSIEGVHFISITSTSNKILQSFIDLNLISKERTWSFLDFNSFELKIDDLSVDSDLKYILVCDVISTGFLAEKLATSLQKREAELNRIAVLVSIIDETFRKDKNYLKSIPNGVISLLDYRVDKFEPSEFKDEVISKNIIRINPYTKIPIRLSFEETNYDDSILFHSTIQYNEDLNEITFQNEFLDSVKPENLKLGYFKYNNVIHPYFFDTKPILDHLDIEVLKKAFEKINKPNLHSEKVQIFYPRNSGIKSDIFFTNVKTALGNDDVEVIEIDRINTVEGWRFPHNSKHLSSKVDNNLCLIIDDGSSTGDSLVQMIDEISFYNAKEIILLCFIGRINDHKREFFSRLSSIRVQNDNIINLSIFFGTHWHIPTYYLDSNPIIKETNWLKELIGIANTPNNIKEIASKILEEIEPKGENFQDYKYLPKVKGTTKIPKKELIKRREEIGKVIGYRLYKESFNYFNAFVKKYSQDRKENENNRYEEVELVCACFVYEPYLYDKLSKILPDVVVLIEKFVRFLIYSFDSYEKHRAFDWDKKDVIHLFFIVFKGDKLLEELSKDNFIKLIEFTNPKETSLSYVLYKLARYFPLNKKSLVSAKYDLRLKKLVKDLIDSKSPHHDILRQYFNYVSTLPSRGDFTSQLFNLQAHYKRQQEGDLHLNKEQFGHHVSGFVSIVEKLIATLKKNEDLHIEDVKKLKKLWMHITEFTTPVLTFTSSFPEFLTPWPSYTLYKKIEDGDFSVRRKIGFNDNVVFALNTAFKDVEGLIKMSDNIKSIQAQINEDSLFYKLISFNTTNLNELFEELINGFKGEKIKVEYNETTTLKDFSFCSIPKVYSKVLIVEEVINNLINHGVLEKGITLEIRNEKDSILVVLKNEIKKKEISNSTREGTRCLSDLSESGIYGFSYHKKEIENQFVQTLRFIVNGDE